MSRRQRARGTRRSRVPARGFLVLAILILSPGLYSQCPDAFSQEHQKRLPFHSVRVRPDIVIHVPSPARGDRREGNSAVTQSTSGSSCDHGCSNYLRTEHAGNCPPTLGSTYPVVLTTAR